LLEIGSGPGTDWKILSETYDVTGSDNSQEFLNHLTFTFPKGKFIELDAVSLKTSSTFDGIYSNKVLHHLTDEALEKSIERQHQLINLEGMICHTFWLGNDTENFNGLFVNYHSEDELKEFFSPLFDVLIMEKYKEFEDDDSILLIGRKK
jgi:cyclopropane fatty-acyl-phospholipid synthase-like methyltransferase